MVPPRTAVASPAALATPPHELRRLGPHRRARHRARRGRCTARQRAARSAAVRPKGASECWPQNVAWAMCGFWGNFLGLGFCLCQVEFLGTIYEIKACGVFYQESLNFKISCDHVFFQTKKETFQTWSCFVWCHKILSFRGFTIYGCYVFFHPFHFFRVNKTHQFHETWAILVGEVFWDAGHFFCMASRPNTSPP